VILGAPANFTEHRIHQIWLALGLFAAGALVVAALAGLVLARSLTLPLGRLETTVDRFGRGDLASRASEREGPPEVRALAHQFNSMAVRLDTLIDSQKRFVADASHQLRSPLTALRLRIENLEATAGPEVGATAAAIGREVQRLSRIVDGLLTLGRAGEEGPQATDVKVHEVIAERCASWSDLAEEKGVQLVADGSAPAGLTARLRPGDLEQILDNLLANAVEVSPPGSTIRVDLRPPAHGRAEVHVVDEGPGLSEEGRSRAFDRFWQGTERPSGHSGLGLAIVAQLAARNDAAVELRAGAPSGLDAVVTVAARQVKER
jgi:signal transduction histidine kinase